MHLEFQNGIEVDYTNVSKIEIHNEVEFNILQSALNIYKRENKEDFYPAYIRFREGDKVVVVSEDTRIPKGTICVVERVSGVHTEPNDTCIAIEPYYIRNIESEYCCWVYEDQVEEAKV